MDGFSPVFLRNTDAFIFLPFNKILKVNISNHHLFFHYKGRVFYDIQVLQRIPTLYLHFIKIWTVSISFAHYNWCIFSLETWSFSITETESSTIFKFSKEFQPNFFISSRYELSPFSLRTTIDAFFHWEQGALHSLICTIISICSSLIVDKIWNYVAWVVAMTYLCDRKKVKAMGLLLFSMGLNIGNLWTVIWKGQTPATCGYIVFMMLAIKSI